jgi:hypothetical protein
MTQATRILYRELFNEEVDGYEIHRSWYGGIVAKNPLRMGEFIPDILA